MHCLLRVPGEAMMSLMSGALGTHGHVSWAKGRGACDDARALPRREASLEPRNTWRQRRPSLWGDGPSRTWRPQSPPVLGGGSGVVATPEPFPAEWRARLHVATPEPSRTRSGSIAVGHVATPEPFPVGWRPRCHGARCDARALRHQKRVWSRGDMQ
jgi:hypothetical protein